MRQSLGGISVLHWAGSGETFPVICLHGIGSAAESWSLLAEALDETFSIFAWDMPGYGASDDLTILDPRTDSYATALSMMLDAAEIPRAIIVGHSLGALIAGRFAAKWPERTAGLALLSPALGYHVQPGQALPANVQARIDDLERLGPEQFAASRAANLVYRPTDNPKLVEQIQKAMASVRQPGYGNAVHILAGGDLVADARIVSAPTIVITGTNDIVTPASGARLVHGNLRQAAGYVEIQHAGHALPQQAPDQTARTLQVFFTAISERPS